ncbi:MAG: type IV secretion system DNA-binding domain-containing protein, partial [Acidobacteriota bacterium]|nr:type IV secretion system DNA-binding domain-containing protein [Acidobacteriota bacterium]
IKRHLSTLFPDFAVVDEEPIEGVSKWHELIVAPTYHYHPIKAGNEFAVDPYGQLVHLLDSSGEHYTRIQVIFTPLKDSDLQPYLDLLKDKSQRGLKAQQETIKEKLEGLRKKLPAWGVSIRLLSTNPMLPDQLYRNFLRQYDTNQQSLAPFTEAGNRSSNAWWWSTLSTTELVSLAHFPSNSLLERFETASMKSKLPPESYADNGVVIGTSEARGKTATVTIPEAVRDRHVYVVGKSGTGKSTIIENIARQDIEQGLGVAVIDPHGDMVKHLLDWMPAERVDDCIYFSPKSCPLSLEILTADNEHEIDLLSDDLLTMFRRTSESWGDRMQAILQMTFQTLLRVPGSSFTDISRLLTDETYRAQILSKIDHPQLINFWQHRYDMRQAEPILIRMDRLTTSSALRNVLTQNSNSLNFYDVISEGKIFLADLSKGQMGESTSQLLGSIIVSQIQLAAMRQAQLPAEQRVPFSLFVDEVQNFITGAFTTILSEARKYKLKLSLAHQFVSQLPLEIQKAIFGNVGTMIFFAMSPDDLGAARHELGSFEPVDVANLPKYHALCRPTTAAKDTFSFTTLPPPPFPEQTFTEAIIEQTKERYGTPAAPQPAAPVTAVQATASEPQAQPAAGPASIKLQPAKAEPLTFATNTEKILHYIQQAEYLSQPQIIALTKLQASNASTALKKLVQTGQVKALEDRRPKIYFIGRSCNPTTHNLLVRDLFVKICNSDFAMRGANFAASEPGLNPDLTVEFVAENGQPILTYWELDRGTEGVSELARKAERYAGLATRAGARVGFIFERASDMQIARQTIPHPFIVYGVLSDFTSLRDSAFYAAGAAGEPQTFFN